jgi:hypothetical protein
MPRILGSSYRTFSKAVSLCTVLERQREHLGYLHVHSDKALSLLQDNTAASSNSSSAAAAAAAAAGNAAEKMMVAELLKDFDAVVQAGDLPILVKVARYRAKQAQQVSVAACTHTTAAAGCTNVQGGGEAEQAAAVAAAGDTAGNSGLAPKAPSLLSCKRTALQQPAAADMSTVKTGQFIVLCYLTQDSWAKNVKKAGAAKKRGRDADEAEEEEGGQGRRAMLQDSNLTRTWLISMGRNTKVSSMDLISANAAERC